MTNLMILFLPYHHCTGDQDCKLTQIRALRRHNPDYFLHSKGWNISEITYELSKYASKSCAYNKVCNMLPGNTGLLQKAALWPMALWPMANGLMFSSNCTNTFHSCSTESICKLLVQRLLITCINYLSASCRTCSDQ